MKPIHGKTQEGTGKKGMDIKKDVEEKNKSASRGFRAFRGLLRSDLLINSGMVFSASFFGALFMFVSNLVLSRVFGPSDFGMYKTVLGLFIVNKVVFL